MSRIIQIRRDLAANFTDSNIILKSGEPAIETDTRKEKIGNGVTPWRDLPYRNLGNNSENKNIDGGSALSIYLSSQSFNGGGA